MFLVGGFIFRVGYHRQAKPRPQCIIGAGCYTDQDVGSAGATGSGEENIRVAGAHTVIENMRRGMSPQEAGLDALKRITRNFNHDQSKVAYLSMKYYILRKDGAYAGVTLWSEDEPARFCVHDGQKRLEPLVAMFQASLWRSRRARHSHGRMRRVPGDHGS